MMFESDTEVTSSKSIQSQIIISDSRITSYADQITHIIIPLDVQ